MKDRDQRLFRRSWLFAGGFTLLLWLVRTLEWSTSSSFGSLGIFPRHASGMVGILTAPLVHGDFLHLISNTVPILLLLTAVFFIYPRIALQVFAAIYLITGFWVWIAAREAYHIGASGLVYGLAAFLFFSGVFRRDVRSTAVALAVTFLYSGMLQGLLPGSDASISWESHLLGAAAGVFCSFYYRRSDPAKATDGKALEQEGAFSSTHIRNASGEQTPYFFHTDEGDHLRTLYRYRKKD
ncbi:MAG: rhomboid family intramembrane serine protease [Tunicatimonas sp.]